MGEALGQVGISIITPFYNVEEYAAECLDSVLSQPFADIEMICIDDGSTDRTIEVLESYQAKDPRVVLVKQENSGPSVGRNKGLSIARGRYISFVDSDDYLAPGALEKSYALACGYNADIVHFNAETVFANTEYIEELQLSEDRVQRNLINNNYIRKGFEEHNTKDGPTFFSFIYSLGGYRTPIWLNLFSKSMIDKHQLRFLEGLLHADDPFTFKAFLSAGCVVFCDDVMYYRRFRPGSIMTTPIGRLNAVSRILGQQHMQEFIEEKAPEMDGNALRLARNYLHYRWQGIVKAYMKYLSDDESDAEIRGVFNSLNDYKEAVAPPPRQPGELTKAGKWVKDAVKKIKGIGRDR